MEQRSKQKIITTVISVFYTIFVLIIFIAAVYISVTAARSEEKITIFFGIFVLAALFILAFIFPSLAQYFIKNQPKSWGKTTSLTLLEVIKISFFIFCIAILLRLHQLLFSKVASYFAIITIVIVIFLCITDIFALSTGVLVKKQGLIKTLKEVKHQEFAIFFYILTFGILIIAMEILVFLVMYGAVFLLVLMVLWGIVASCLGVFSAIQLALQKFVKNKQKWNFSVPLVLLEVLKIVGAGIALLLSNIFFMLTFVLQIMLHGMLIVIIIYDILLLKDEIKKINNTSTL